MVDRSDKGPLQGIARSLVPDPAREALRSLHRAVLFRRGMRRFLAEPEACARPDSPVLRDLIYGWGNEAWSARNEYLADGVRHVLAARGPILECGSGLTTVMFGTIARRRGLAYWALEHLPEWAARVQHCQGRYRIDGVTLHLGPLQDHAAFTWYDPPLDAMPERFSLVICDGPPGGTRGGRYGLVPIMGQRLAPGCVILLDDAAREQEFATARRWETELGAALETLGKGKPYVRLTLPDRPHP